MFISVAIDKITLKSESKMSDQDAIATSPYAENDTLDQQPAVRCQTDKKLPDPGVNQRDHSNDNADPAHENLDNTQQNIANLEKLFDRQSHSLQYLTSALKHLAKKAKPKHSKRKRRYSTSSSSSSSSSSSVDEPLKGQKTTNPTVNSDTEQEAQLLMNQGKQPALIVNEDPSSENHTASSTGDILKSIDDDSNEKEYGPKISDPLGQRVEGKRQTKLKSEKLKKKSKNLLTPENCTKLSVPLTNKEIWIQLNNFQKKSDLRIINMQKNIQKAAVALARVTDGLLQANCNIKETIKINLDAISLLGHVSQDLSSLRRQELKPALHPKCAGLCDLEYTDTKQLFGEDISKSLVKAKEVRGLRKQFQPETYKNSQGSKNQNRFKHYFPKDSFFVQELSPVQGDYHKPETTETGDR